MSTTDTDTLSALRAHLAQDQGGILEALAAEHGVSLRTVVECLPTGATMAAGSLAEAALADISGWGPVTVLVHTADIVLECKGPLPAGRMGHGFFNLGGGSPIGGHIRLDHCVALAFVRRPFMGSDSCSVTFFNAEGGAMFKVFVGRDDKRQLLADQVARFDALRERLGGEAA